MSMACLKTGILMIQFYVIIPVYTASVQVRAYNVYGREYRYGCICGGEGKVKVGTGVLR